MEFNWLGAIIFIVGIILIGLSLTYLPEFTKPLLLAGIVIAGGGVMFSSLFKES